MKKLLAVSAAALCAMAPFGAVFAESTTIDQDSSPKTAIIDAFYDVSEAFTVTIPSEIIFSGYNSETEGLSVVTSGVLLENGNKLSVSVVPTLGVLKNGESTISYSIYQGSEYVTVAAGTSYPLVSINATDASSVRNATYPISFKSGDSSNVKLAGKHSDVLTFNVGIIDSTD